MARPGGERRGNWKDRAARKRWLLCQFGNGMLCHCTHCGRVLDYATVEADRKIPGGSYRHANIQPACRHCNASRSNRENWVAPLQLRTMLTIA